MANKPKPTRRSTNPLRATRLAPLDLARHRRMLAGLYEAQQLQARANDLSAAFRVWAGELHERYGLEAAIGEGIAEDGTITRRDPGPEKAPETKS